MNKDGMDTTQVRSNKGRDELTFSAAEAFKALEEGGKLPPVEELPVSEKTGRKVPQGHEEPPVEEPPKEEPPVEEPPVEEPPKKEPPVEEPPVEEPPVEEPNYDLDEINKLLDDEKEEKSPEHSRADDDDVKEDIKEIRENPHTPEKTKKSIDRLLGNNNRLKATLQTERDKVVSLEARVSELENAKPQENPVTEEERHELNMLRMKHNIGSDENIKKNFDDPIAAAEKKIYKIIDKSLEPDQAKQVKDLGFEVFARRFPSSYKELWDSLNDNAPLDAGILSSSVNSLLTLKDARSEEVERLTSNADEYFANLDKEMATRTEQGEAQLKELKEKTYTHLISSNPAFVEIPTKGLAGEELKLAERENSLRKGYREMGQKFVDVDTLEGQNELILRATLSLRLADRVKSLLAEIDRLKSEKGDVISSRSLRPPKEVPAPKEEAPPAPSSFSQGMDEAANRTAARSLRQRRSVPR
jgi:hypothetical protein